MPSGRQRSRAWAVVALFCAVALAALAALVATRWHPLISLDIATDKSAHDAVVAHHWLERASRDITQLGDTRVIDLLTIAGAVAAATRRRWDLVALVVGVRLLEYGVNWLAKGLVDRPRPHLLHPVADVGGASFPSGHAAGTAAVFGVLTLLFLRAGNRALTYIVVSVVVLLIVCVGASRVLLGVHYPSDVAAGFLVGGLALAVMRFALPAK